MAKNASQSRERISDKIIFDMPVSVDAKFSSALRTVLVEASTASWEFWFGLLAEFKEREGHCNVSTLHREDGLKLGQWVAVQRRNPSTLSADRLAKLNALNFVWHAFETAWEVGFSQLQKFFNKEGHANVSMKHVEDGYKLGSWVSNQRTKQPTLSAEQLAKLNDVGFVWEVWSSAWDLGYEKLQEFHQREGHSLVPRDHIEDGYKLGSWVSNQRTKQLNLSAEMLAKLDELGFVWNKIEHAWQDGFDQLKVFQLREGHCRVPNKHVEKDYNLGSWVSFQRARHAKLPSDKVRLLDGLGFVWNQREVSWEQGFSSLKLFHGREGHCKVPSKHKEGDYYLGPWVSNQRQKWSTISAENKRRLEALGFIWDTSKDKT
jgi:hypothetical protein